MWLGFDAYLGLKRVSAPQRLAGLSGASIARSRRGGNSHP